VVGIGSRADATTHLLARHTALFPTSYAAYRDAFVAITPALDSWRAPTRPFSSSLATTRQHNEPFEKILSEQFSPQKVENLGQIPSPSDQAGDHKTNSHT
jgi:hypothetical protein